MLEKKKKAICWSFLETLWLIFGYTPYPISISIEVGNKETRMWPLSTRISNAQDDPECSQPAFILTTLLWKWEPDNCVWSSDRWCERWSLRAKTTAENMRTNVWKGNHVSVIPLITFDQISDIPLGWNSLHQQVVMVHRAGNVSVALKGMVRGHGGARLQLLSSIIFPMRMVTALSAIHGVWGRWQWCGRAGWSPHAVSMGQPLGGMSGEMAKHAQCWIMRCGNLRGARGQGDGMCKELCRVLPHPVRKCEQDVWGDYGASLFFNPYS